jgi:hypothetical protein
MEGVWIKMKRQNQIQVWIRICMELGFMALTDSVVLLSKNLLIKIIINTLGLIMPVNLSVDFN